MSDLQTFFRLLSAWEGEPVLRLAKKWTDGDKKELKSSFRTAAARCRFGNCRLIVPASTSNQAVGNRVAEFFIAKMNQRLRRFWIERCKGQGYPDARLVHIRSRRAFAMELKATTSFDPRDGNRVVLTCASRKLRRLFRRAVPHLLATICYQRKGRQIRVLSVRLGFLQPRTRVKVRFEASLSKRLMVKAPSEFSWIYEANQKIARSHGRADGNRNSKSNGSSGHTKRLRKVRRRLRSRRLRGRT
jgi:hypothetical protein